MKELRTLKDFEPDDIIKKGQIDYGVSARELKAEAVEWIKDMQNRGDFHLSAYDWIKLFFNITGEELAK